jgi:hypothetical protein
MVASTIYYVGNTPESVLGGEPRYLYTLRRTDDGDLYIGRWDQIQNESIAINRIGNDPQEDYPEFEVGVDFVEGRDIDHLLVYENLIYEQFRWDGRFLNYYINSDGEFVVKVAQSHDYSIPG